MRSGYGVVDRVEELRKNIDAEIRMISELNRFVERYEHSGNKQERKIYLGVIDSLKKRVRLVNDSIPGLTRNISLTKNIPSQNKTGEQTTSVPLGDDRTEVVVRSGNRANFLKELNISEALIKKLKKKRFIQDKKSTEFRKPGVYSKLANKFFLGISESWIRRGKFKNLSLNLRRSNVNILTSTYLSMIILSVFISIFVGLGVFVLLLFFTIGLDFPFVGFYSGNLLERVIKVVWVIIAIPTLTSIAFYLYPGAEKKSLATRIDQELPFVVIHMASVSGSGIEPIEIFKIIGMSKEYKYTQKEIRKILNQTNIYGYDLTTALRNVSQATPSTRLAELLNGISITINSGGDIKTFFEKRGESLLLEYRLEREKFTKTAETFMDIYISIVIAAPMILLMLLIMISVSGIQTGFSVNQMTIAIIGIVAIINILFLTFLHLKQPTY